jgi:MFS family permease
LAKKESFYGWWIVFAGFMLMFSCVGIIVNCVSIFFKPVIESLGFSRAEFSLYFTFINLSMMVVAPFMGKILSKYNMRAVVTTCLIIGATAYMAYSRCTALMHFYILSIIVGAALAGLFIPVSVMCTNWFVEKRGLAMGIAFTGSGIGGMLFNPLTNWLILNYGWQNAYVVLGIILLVTIIPISLFVIRATPAEKGQVAYGAGTDSTGQNTAQALSGMALKDATKTASFWLLGIGVLLIGLMNMGIQMHIPAFLTDKGYSSTFAANVVALFMGVLVIGKLVLGSIFDKFGSRIGMAYACTVFILAAFVLMGAKTATWVGLFAILFGLANAMATVAAPFITAEIFGAKNYGVIYGVINVFFTLGMSVGMPLSGAIFDARGSYIPAFTLYAVAAVVVAVLLIIAIGRGKDALKSFINA